MTNLRYNNRQMSKAVILTGLRANNDLHIGNYFGALLPMVDMATQKATDYEVNLMMADLHSFNVPVDHKTLHQQITDNIAAYVAAGLPLQHDSVRLFRESHVPAHSELAVILSNFSGFGEVSRMTQFKDKSAKLGANRVSAGLFNYPILMAADILLYGAKYVPVGDDQTQHLEFTRDVAQRMNTKFGELFVVPEPVKKQHEFFGKDQGLRIRDLQDPTKKMSKSDDTGKGVIFLTDSPEVARKKIMSASTDSDAHIRYDYEKQPGVSNLLDILKLLGGEPKDFIDRRNDYGNLKAEVANVVAHFLTEFQKILHNVKYSEIETKLSASEKAMNEQANATLLKVQKAVGLRK